MLDINIPHMTGDANKAARELSKAAREVGAKATGNVLRIIESPTTKTIVWGTLVLVGASLAFRFYSELRNEVIHKPRQAKPQ